MVIIQDIDERIATLGQNRMDRFRRNSFLVLREHFQSSAPPLRLELGDQRHISASNMATITQALQDATARVAMLLLHPNQDRTRLTANVRSKAELIPQGQSGNTLYFRFPERVQDANDLFSGVRIPHLAEEAVRELVNALPESNQDEATLRSLPGRRVAIRSAVATLARAVGATGDVSLALRASDGEQQVEHASVLTKAQAVEVKSLLSTEFTEKTETVIDGILDGMRSRRRLFYIVSEDPTESSEFEGIVDPALLSDVRIALNQRVKARVSKTVIVSGDGSRSHPIYSLISLQIDPRL